MTTDPLMPAFLLIFAIYRVKSQIKRLNKREIIARVNLLRVHTFSFIFVIMAFFATGVIMYESWRVGQSEKEIAIRCRYMVAYNSCLIIADVSNTVILFLFTYMSIKFSRLPPRVRNESQSRHGE